MLSLAADSTFYFLRVYDSNHVLSTIHMYTCFRYITRLRRALLIQYCVHHINGCLLYTSFSSRYSEHLKALTNNNIHSAFATHIHTENHSYTNIDTNLEILHYIMFIIHIGFIKVYFCNFFMTNDNCWKFKENLTILCTLSWVVGSSRTVDFGEDR